LLRTTYSPNQPGEQLVNNSNHSITPVDLLVATENYSQRQSIDSGGGEQLSFLSGSRFGCGSGFGRGLGLGGRFLALQIGIPPFPFLSFIVLLAHNTLYIPDVFRLFGLL
jgi:hypothetical protein